MTSVRFTHGLGDCANFAFLLELYRRHGHEIGVVCAPDKAPLFKTFAPDGERHPWYNAPLATPPSAGVLAANKVGHNISRDPLPTLDVTPEEAWRELLDIRLAIELPPREDIDKIERLLDDCPKPWVLWHPHANTSAPIKSYTNPKESLAITHALLDSIGHGTVILLDWDNRVPRVESRRVRHLDDDEFPRDVKALAYLIARADLFIGVDSGPLHLARFTDTPAIGAWKAHHPVFYALPRRQTINLVARENKQLPSKDRPDLVGWDRETRCEFQTVLSRGPQPSPEEIGELASEIAVRWYSPAEVFANRLCERTRSSGAKVSNYVDRNKTFRMVMDHLRDVAASSGRSPVMVETGCIRSPEDWGGAGYSTYLFGALFRTLGTGKLYSVELNPKNCEFARAACREVSEFVAVHCCHSHDWLSNADGPSLIDVFYSDSLDTTSPGHEENCLREVQLAVPRMTRDGLILIDDTVQQYGRWSGKGATAIPWLLSQGWRIVYSGYQCLLSRASA